ncbi:MAG: VOC family protein [Proteobacteria bacterium]|nr:VOC family protein [Pseudomonadota bacterium]
MLDHIGFGVADYEASKAFYLKALEPLGIGVVMLVIREQTGGYEGAGFGSNGKPYFWIGTGEPVGHMHLAFAAETRAEVDAFYAAALAAGAKDNGAPGLRPWYHPNYYGAFVIDLNGVNLEAVCHKAE